MWKDEVTGRDTDEGYKVLKEENLEERKEKGHKLLLFIKRMNSLHYVSKN